MTTRLFKQGQKYWWFHVETGQGGEREFNPPTESQEYWRTLQENINIWNYKASPSAPHHWAYGLTREEAISKMLECREYLGLEVAYPIQFYP